MKLGVPQESRDAFDMLCEAEIITSVLGDRLKAMVGLRNVAVHDYRKLNLELVRNILAGHLDDFREFGAVVLRAEAKKESSGSAEDLEHEYGRTWIWTAIDAPRACYHI